MSTRFVLFSAVARVTPAHLAAIAAACTPALADVARAWAPVYPEIVAPKVRVAASATDFAHGEIPVLFVAALDEPGDLAYHFVKNGLPYAVVLADEYQELQSIQQAAWHECAEALVDPSCGRHDAAGWAIEVCDPVQSDPIAGLGGVNLSPFVMPAWFGLGAGPVDSAGLLAAPHTVRPGAYAMKQDGSEIHGEGYQHATGKFSLHSRRMKRRRATHGAA